MKIKIGYKTYGNPKILSWNHDSKLTIGRYCCFADDVTILVDGNYRKNRISNYPFDTSPKGETKIGNDVWACYGATILPNVTIGDGAIIMAGSVVTKNVKAFSIVGGIPAKLIKMRFSDEKIKVIKKESWWDWTDNKIINMKAYLTEEQTNN